MARFLDTFDDQEDDEAAEPRVLRCKRCGSTDVRWRMQGGRWTLFSLRPGVEHACPPLDADDPRTDPRMGDFE